MRADSLHKYSTSFKRWIGWRRILMMIAIVVVAEFAILIPVYFDHKQEALDRIGVIGETTISSTFLSHSNESGRDLLRYGAAMTAHSIVRGGALYWAGGRLIGTFGELPSLAFKDGVASRYSASEGRYETVIPLAGMGMPLTIVSRLDATELPSSILDRLQRSAAIALAFVILVMFAGIVIMQRRSIEKRSEIELREREKRLTAVVENSPSSIYLKDRDGHFLMVNREYERLHDVSREQILDKSVHDVFPAEAAASMTAQDRRIIETKTVLRQMHEYRGPDGEMRTVSQTKFPIMDFDGEVMLIGGIGSDVTERQQYQKALVESEQRYRRLIESVPGAVYVQVDGRIVFANFAALDMFGADTADQLVGTASTGLFHPDDRNKIAARRKIARQSDAKMPFIEVRHLRLDGTIFEGESTSTKIVWEGTPAILVEIRDITDRKLAERIAEKHQDQYRQFMELLPDAVFIHCNDKVVFVNPATVEMFGAGSADDMIGRSALNLIHPDEWEKIRVRRHKIDQGQSVAEVDENLYVRVDGTQFQGEGRASRITWNAEPAHLVAVRDITERKEVEAAMENAMTAAETSNRTKSEFLANMSHELRTPLNAIIGFSEIFLQQMVGPLGHEKYLEYAGDIHLSGNHLLNLINDILDISKIESGEAQLFEQDVDFPDVVGTTLRLLDGRATTNNVEMICDMAAELPLLRADQRKLKQILLNLVSNAVKFSNAGGTVIVRAWSALDSGFVIQVEDSGIGIALRDIPRALAPFQQIDSDLNRSYEGTGLGLPLTKSLVELHGGSLNLDSEVGVGTTVTVRFPASRIVTSCAGSEPAEFSATGTA